jgi:ABC-type molybdate transport system substrate-binding protein
VWFFQGTTVENKYRVLAASLGLALLGITAGSTARAVEIKLLCAVALHPAIDALIPDFEKSSGHKVTVAYGTAGAVADRVQKGEAADIVISSVPLIDQLQAQGKVVAGSRVNIAKVGVGVFVRKGTAKPDISSADAFKRSMLAAKSIAYPDPAGGGASGIYVAIVGSDFEKTMIAGTPLGRFGQPDDIARIAVFLASDDSAWLTGERITASGGYR